MTDQPSQLTFPEAAPFLASTPTILRSVLTAVPSAWLDFREAPDAWSPRLVVVHFIHNERTNWLPRMRVILADQAERRFEPFQQMPEPGQVDDADLSALLTEFSSLRADNLEAIDALRLSDADYKRTGEHPVLGTVNLGQLLATWVVHDLNHTHQILKSLAKVQRQAVGPWRPNLAILDL